MNVFEVAQFANNRLNGGAVGKFPVTLATVNETAILHRVNTKSLKDIIIINEDYIAYLINTLDNENELRMLENVKDCFTLLKLVKVIQDVFSSV